MSRSAEELLNELNHLDEHVRLEAKAGAGDSLLETICAFANEPGLGGGQVLVGVRRIPGPETHQLGTETHQLGTETHQLETETHQLETDLHQLGTDLHQLGTDLHQLPSLPPELQDRLRALGKRPAAVRLAAAIVEVCRVAPHTAEQLAGLFGRRDPKDFRRTHLAPLVAQRRLAYTIPEMPNHPRQAYRAPRQAASVAENEQADV